MINESKIALITPLKNEIENLPKFISALEKQTTPIGMLVIVENDSDDGSKEFLEKLDSIDNVGLLKVLNISFEDKTYRVGKKYASIIKTGMDYIKGHDLYKELDYIGILDCDVFPEEVYYEKLTRFMTENSDIGIASGLTYTPEGVLHIANPNFVRGNSRLWKKRCLEEAGYLIAHTADTVSLALAHLRGWKAKTLKSTIVISREINVRISSYKNKGYHAYYRGHTLVFIFLRALFLAVVKGRFKLGFEYLGGYLEGMLKQKPRIEDLEVRRYFRFYLFNKLTKRYE